MTASFKKLRKARRALQEWELDRRLNDFYARPYPTPWGDTPGPGISTSALRMLKGEAEGFALDFTDDTLYETTGHYGSAAIKDLTTPANYYNSHPFGLLTYSSPSLKLVRGPDGNLRYNAHNFHPQSDNISAWSTVGATVTQDSFGYLVQESTSSGFHYLFINALRNDGHLYVRELDVYPAGRTFVEFGNGGNATGGACFSLTGDGSVTSTHSSVVEASITKLEDGWYRCRTVSPHDFNTSRIVMRTSSGLGNGQIYQGDGTSGFYLRRAVVRRYPTDPVYLKTTSSARYELPYEWDTDGNLLGIRVEEQRTNLCLHSSDLTQSAWTKSNITTAKTATGPDGVANSATTLTATANNGFVRQNITSASAERITSLYVRRRTGSGGVYLSQGDAPGPELVTNGEFDADADWTKGEGWTISDGKASIDGSNGTESRLTQSLSTATGNLYKVSYTISDYVSGQVRLQIAGIITVSGEFHNANGTYTWYYNATSNNTLVRFSADAGTELSVDNVSIKEVSQEEITATINWTRYTTGAATIENPQVLLRLASSGDEIDVALFQHEVGSFVTSPIETAGSTVTRAADEVSLATSKFPSIEDEFTVLVSGIMGDVTTNNGALWSIAKESGANDRIDSTGTAALGGEIRVASSGTDSDYRSTNVNITLSAGDPFRAAYGCAPNGTNPVNLQMYVNGIEGGLSGAATQMPTGMELLRLRNSPSRNRKGLVWFKEVVVLPRRWTDSELDAWTEQ